MHDYIVTVTGPDDEALCERWAAVAKYRLETLEEREGHYPEIGGQFDMLDHFEGPFFWERTDEEMEDDPPSRVDFEVVEVDPIAAPSGPSTVRVTANVPF